MCPHRQCRHAAAIKDISRKQENMKKRTHILTSVLMGIALVACQEQYITYNDKSYVMFAEAEQERLVTKDQEYFSVTVAATNATPNDRTFGVEVIDKGSNAIEGIHYRLLSNSVTIPAGERSAEIKIKGYYDNIAAADSLGFILSLVMPEELEWDLYAENKTSKVTLYKSCPFVREDFTGWCLVSSLMLLDYPGENTSYQRLVRTKAHPTMEDAIVIESFLYDGYDITLRFAKEDPAKPLITIDEQVISDEKTIFGIAWGDNKVRATHSRNAESYFNSCQKFAVVWLHAYIEDLGTPVGTVGHYYNVLEWVSDAEAEEIMGEL